MQHTNSTKSYLFPHKMYIKFNVLGALMMNWVGREVDCTHVVAIDNSGGVKRNGGASSHPYAVLFDKWELMIPPLTVNHLGGTITSSVRPLVGREHTYCFD